MNTSTIKYLLGLFAFSPIFLIGQTQPKTSFKWQLGSGAGYEYNVYNAGNNQFFLIGEDSIVGIQSGFFQRLQLNVAGKISHRQSTIGFKLRNRYDYFPSLTEANVIRPEVSVFYQYKLKKFHSLIWEGNYVLNRTNNLEDATSVINTTNSYRRAWMELAYKFRPIRFNASKLTLSLQDKAYAEQETGQLRYVSKRINFQSKQRFKRKGKNPQYLILDAYVEQRNYEDIRFFEIEEEEEEFEEEFKERIWRYYTGKVSYEKAVTDQLELGFGLSYLERTDVLADRLGYQQPSVFTQLSYEDDKWSILMKLQYDYRQYRNLKASNNQEDKLLHQYLRASLRANYKIADQWEWQTSLQVRQRWRNYSAGATRFLPYANVVLSSGLR
ncbi:MAG: hypothetical protein HRU41_40445 [Saprospiraceae bacterium]|nr:hypothetical protein [Saprospiraceae bacterium]